jgi:hypothetical protein
MIVFRIAALAALVVLTLGVAHADPQPGEQQFLDAVHSAGFTQPDPIALRDGYLVCAAASQEGVGDDLIDRTLGAVQTWLGHQPTPELNAAFNDAAVQFLCPAAGRTP